MTIPEEVPGELVDEFQVEELEERVEFAEWGSGPTVPDGSVKMTVET